MKSASALNVIQGIHDRPARICTNDVMGVATSKVTPGVPTPTPTPSLLKISGPIAEADSEANPNIAIVKNVFISRKSFD